MKTLTNYRNIVFVALAVIELTVLRKPVFASGGNCTQCDADLPCCMPYASSCNQWDGTGSSCWAIGYCSYGAASPTTKMCSCNRCF